VFQEQHKQTRLKQFQSLKGEIPITQRKSTLSYRLQRKTIIFEYTTNSVNIFEI